MALTELLTADAILPSLRCPTKKALLTEMCEAAGQVSGLPARETLDAVLQRERLGSTGVGNGIAIPHGKLLSCTQIFGVFARLERPVDFDAMDGAPVDLAFMLIAPEAAGADHLKALARVARLLRDPQITARLRASRDATALFAVLSRLDPASHAA